MGFRPFKWAPELIYSTSRSREDNVKPMSIFEKNRLEKSKICISIRLKYFLSNKISAYYTNEGKFFMENMNIRAYWFDPNQPNPT